MPGMVGMPSRCPRWVPVLVVALTVVQLLVGAFSGWEQYAGKAFGWRLLAYPVLMLVVPAVWLHRHRQTGAPPPWGAFTLLVLPFLLDVTANTLDLFDSVAWWDDAMHFVNWIFLAAGLGLLLVPRLEPRWLRALVVMALGALLAVGWELGEWYTFIRRGVELDTAYQDTLADEGLGTLGALLAGVLLSLRRDDRHGAGPT